MQQLGVQLIADGGDKYLATLTQTAAAEQALASAAAPAVAAVNALDDKAGAAAKELDRLGSEAGTGAHQMDMFADDASLAAKDAAQLGAATDKAADQVDDLGAAAQKGGKGAKGLGDDAEKGSKGVSLLDKIATGAAEKVGHLLVNAAQQAGQAILRFIGDSVNKAGDFEQGMNRFASVTGEALGESGQSVEDFKKLFISLGRDLPVSTSQVQEAAINMAKGGIEPATIAAGGLRTVLDLAAAGELGIAEAADISAKQLGVWVDRAADATTKAKFLGESADLLAQAANASTVDVDELALGMANVGGIAKVAGLSFRETVTTMAELAPGFSSAADAGTSLKTMLTRLQPTTDTAAAAMQKLNLLTADGKSKFYDTSGAFIGMDKAAGLLHDSLQGLSQAEKTAALQAVFGNDAFRAAAMLAEGGSKGFEDMAASMAKAGTAAQQAAKKQQGWNVAVDNLMGSLEALQITVVTNLLPAMTKIVNLVAGGINAFTDFADATANGETWLSDLAGTVNTLAIPAVSGLAAALLAYWAVQNAQAIPSIIASIPWIAAQTEAFFANAAAVAAAVAPYALIAAAVGGVVLAYQNFNSKVTDATTQLLESRQWWNDSTAAIEDYGNQVGEAKTKLEPYASSIEALRGAIQGEIEDLGRRSAAGLVTQAQYDTEMAKINGLREDLTSMTHSYNEQEQAIIKATTASMTATNAAQTLGEKTDELGNQASLTAKDIEDLGKKIDETFKKGQEAVQSYATAHSEFLSGVEDRQQKHADQIADLEAKKQKATTAEQKKGIDDQIAQANASYRDQEQAAANSYARQQAAQQQHLGQMLIDYTVAQASLGNIAKEKAAEITAALEKEYGLQESSVATTFLHMAQHIDDSAKDSGSSIDDLIGHLRDEQKQAGDTQKALDDYAKEYTAKQTNNFLDGKKDADEYIHSLEKIPTKITTTVVTKYETGGTSNSDPSGGTGRRAAGGPVSAESGYIVGEEGPEYFVPNTSGTIIPNDRLVQALAGSQLSGASSSSVYTHTTIIQVDARGSNLTEADITRGVQAGLVAEGQMADVRVRTGVQ
jgi:TP901 family phage tail tape measure protein